MTNTENMIYINSMFNVDGLEAKIYEMPNELAYVEITGGAKHYFWNYDSAVEALGNIGFRF